jgi:hypothetical protein
VRRFLFPSRSAVSEKLGILTRLILYKAIQPEVWAKNVAAEEQDRPNKPIDAQIGCGRTDLSALFAPFASNRRWRGIMILRRVNDLGREYLSRHVEARHVDLSLLPLAFGGYPSRR